MGLSLSIGKVLIRLMGGIGGVQTRQGLGSEFWVCLAFVVHETRKAGNVRILVVDDARPNRQLLARVLGRRGMLVTLAEDGPAAIAYVETRVPGAFDVILLDKEMPPGPDGIETTRRLRALGVTVPIYGCSGTIVPEDGPGPRVSWTSPPTPRH